MSVNMLVLLSLIIAQRHMVYCKVGFVGMHVFHPEGTLPFEPPELIEFRIETINELGKQGRREKRRAVRARSSRPHPCGHLDPCVHTVRLLKQPQRKRAGSSPVIKVVVLCMRLASNVNVLFNLLENAIATLSKVIHFAFRWGSNRSAENVGPSAEKLGRSCRQTETLQLVAGSAFSHCRKQTE
ncbi:hypothetical protein EMWEY_00039600 [Eimeria maxima]|uniref:Secreted protein n=1 Tax=Eimeria maxima TaxID=5804 RepID=U6ME01_EIMMA|nr:hypothetical protein EMWEY_00039600 [Eimeria maxima]CDJ61283.1 hypothetical protein EMWEY_00039600 [Eimeria maxima]